MIDKYGKLHNCSGAQDISTKISLSDITDDGQLSESGILQEFGPLRTEANCGTLGQSYLMFAGAFRAVIARQIKYEKSKLGLILGLTLGLLLGLVLVALVVLLILKRRGYFLKRPKTRGDGVWAKKQ